MDLVLEMNPHVNRQTPMKHYLPATTVIVIVRISLYFQTEYTRDENYQISTVSGTLHYGCAWTRQGKSNQHAHVRLSVR